MCACGCAGMCVNVCVCVGVRMQGSEEDTGCPLLHSALVPGDEISH